MPSVTTDWPASGEVAPGPWMAAIGTIAKSSLRMVPVPTRVPSCAPEMFDSARPKVSSGSATVSPITPIESRAEVSPSAMMAVPLSAM